MADETLTDPLGRVITLHDRTWFGHILVAHPDLEPLRNLIGRTLSEPLSIRRASYDPHERRYIGSGVEPRRDILVAVDIKLALVKTAFQIRPHRVRGVIEWER